MEERVCRGGSWLGRLVSVRVVGGGGVGVGDENENGESWWVWLSLWLLGRRLRV